MECRYAEFLSDHWCIVESADLSSKTIDASFTFSGTQEQKQKQTRITFLSSGRVAHLPRNIIEEFPKLNVLEIQRSDIPILRNDFFTPEFSKLQVIALSFNHIKIIEENVFGLLPDLKEIDLHENEIKSLPANLFLNNRNLQEINLMNNKIMMIHPGTFKNLNQLIRVDLEGNECIERDFVCPFCDKKLSLTSELHHYLQPCYENHAKSLNLLNEGEHNNEARFCVKKKKNA